MPFVHHLVSTIMSTFIEIYDMIKVSDYDMKGWRLMWIILGIIVALVLVVILSVVGLIVWGMWGYTREVRRKYSDPKTKEEILRELKEVGIHLDDQERNR